MQPDSVILITAPAAEPISTADAKAHLRVDLDDEDTLIASYVASARERVESETGRALINQTWEARWSCFPGDGVLELPLPPLSSVTSVKYVDPDGVEQTMPSGDYVVDRDVGPRAQRSRVVLAESASWPGTKTQPNAVLVRFVAGYGAAATAVPALLIQAVRYFLATYYENRDTVVSGMATTATELPKSVQDALDLFWVPVMA